MSELRKKYLRPPRSAFDIKSQREVVKHINALKNAKVIDAQGNSIGQIFFADGNTVFQIDVSNPLSVLNYTETVAWPKGEALAKVRTDDPAVLDGINIGTEEAPEIIKAKPGKWLALQDVPSPPTLAAHIPGFANRFDNDPENKNNFWECITPAYICDGSSQVEI